MKGVVFDLVGTLAHFRKPDTTATQMTYPFITPTAVKGMVGAILGKEDFVTRDIVGIRLMNPVQIVSQQMSMLGKDTGNSFNRPTTIELLINPHYRIYYAGEENVDELSTYLQKEYSVYPTFLGVAYAVTKPKLISVWNQVALAVNEAYGYIETKAVVPSALVGELKVTRGQHYCRAGGFMYCYKGARTFEKSIDFIYEWAGNMIAFKPAKRKLSLNLQIAKFGEDVVCLY